MGKTAISQIREKCIDKNLSCEEIGKWIYASIDKLKETETNSLSEMYVKGKSEHHLPHKSSETAYSELFGS